MASGEEKEEVYSVWALAPEEQGVSSRLKDLMSSLRSEFDGPEFEPHITVVGAFRQTPTEALRRFRASCLGLKPYTAAVTGVNRGTFFYQCVFLLVDPTDEVRRCNQPTVCFLFCWIESTYMDGYMFVVGGGDEQALLCTSGLQK